MNQTHNTNTYFKSIFTSIRKKYPQQLIQSSSKSSILQQCIKKFYLSEFHTIYQTQSKNNNNSAPIRNQKVLDQNDSIQQNTLINQNAFNNDLMDAIKIIVQAYDKNQAIKDKYQLQQVSQMIEKTKLTLKELLKMKTKEQKNVTNKKSQQTKNIKQQKIQSKSDKNIQSQGKQTQNNKNQSYPIKSQIEQSPASKPKLNSLFVQKQAPISEQNIFKGQNGFRRPSSRLMNQKPGYLKSQKPKSSTKSNRSKRSKASSRGLNDNNDKKSQNLSQSKLSLKQGQQNSDNQNNKDKQPQQKQNNQNEQLNNEDENIQNQYQQDNNQNQQVQEEQQKKIVFDQRQDQFHLPPFRLSKQSPIRKKNPVQSILTNPYIKKSFNHLCKQSYIGGGRTFDQIAQSADIMTLNKWMVFCKQFDFISKLKKKQLVDIFQQCTQNKPHMNQQQFLDALIIVQNKLKVDEQHFIRNNICLDSEFAFRQKVASFKVNYSGPKHNFFQQSTIKPLDKYYQNLKQSKYQIQKQKHKQIIMHQGKFRDQIESQLKQRKNIRDLKKYHGNNVSLIQKRQSYDKGRVSSSIQNKVYDNNSIQSPYLKYIQNQTNIKNNGSIVKNDHQLGLSKLYISRRIEPLSYSQLFSQKNSISTRAFTTQKRNSQVNSNHAQKYSTQIKQQKDKHQNTQRNERNNANQHNSKPQTGKQENKIKIKLSQKNSLKTTQKKHEQAQEAKPRREWVQQIKNWAQQFDKTQSQQSDDILREHLMNEKMKQKHLPKRIQLPRMVDQYKNYEKWLQPTDPDNNQQWDRQTQLQTTRNKQRFK